MLSYLTHVTRMFLKTEMKVYKVSHISKVLEGISVNKNPIFNFNCQPQLNMKIRFVQ